MRKSYYAIIPANVRYCKKIPAGAKLVYGEITALTNERGYCWANNRYFADLYGVEKRTIRRWVNSLVKQKFVKVSIKKIADNKSKRKIYLGVGTKMSGGLRQKCPLGGDKNVLHNTTVNNTFNRGKNKKEYKEGLNGVKKLKNKMIAFGFNL